MQYGLGIIIQGMGHRQFLMFRISGQLRQILPECFVAQYPRRFLGRRHLMLPQITFHIYIRLHTGHAGAVTELLYKGCIFCRILPQMVVDVHHTKLHSTIPVQLP